MESLFCIESTYTVHNQPFHSTVDPAIRQTSKSYPDLLVGRYGKALMSHIMYIISTVPTCRYLGPLWNRESTACLSVWIKIHEAKRSPPSTVPHKPSTEHRMEMWGNWYKICPRALHLSLNMSQCLSVCMVVWASECLFMCGCVTVWKCESVNIPLCVGVSLCECVWIYECVSVWVCEYMSV